MDIALDPRIESGKVFSGAAMYRTLATLHSQTANISTLATYLLKVPLNKKTSITL